MFGMAAVIYAAWIGMKSSSRPLSILLAHSLQHSVNIFLPSTLLHLMEQRQGLDMISIFKKSWDSDDVCLV